MNAWAQGTSFTDSGGDHLRSNPANWDNGLPTFTSAVTQTSNTGTNLTLDSITDIETFNNGNDNTSSLTITGTGVPNVT